MTDAEIAGIMGWRGPGCYTEAQMRKVRQCIEQATKSAMLAESAEWTGDYRGPVFRAFEAVARRMGVALTRHECESVSSASRNGKEC